MTVLSHKLAEYWLRFNHPVPLEVSKSLPAHDLIRLIDHALSAGKPVLEWEQRQYEKNGTVFDQQYPKLRKGYDS